MDDRKITVVGAALIACAFFAPERAHLQPGSGATAPAFDHVTQVCAGLAADDAERDREAAVYGVYP